MAVSATSQARSSKNSLKSQTSNTSKKSATSKHGSASANMLSECTTSSLPIGTMLVIASCFALYFDVFGLTMFSVDKSCAGLYQIFYWQENLRIITCHFNHTNIWELAFQMSSFAWKGFLIERRCGAKFIIMMISLFTPFCTVSLLLLHKALADYHDTLYLTRCFCGFASINFALKVVNTYQAGDEGGVECMVGNRYCIKLKYFEWLEIIIAHFISETSTIVANIAGCLVGLLYISGLLKKMMDIIMKVTSGEIQMSTSSLPGLGFLKSLVGRSPSKGFGSPCDSIPCKSKASRKKNPSGSKSEPLTGEEQGPASDDQSAKSE